MGVGPAGAGLAKAKGFNVLGPSPLALSLFSPGISMFSMVVFVEVINLDSEDVSAVDNAGTGVGMGFFLFVGLAFFGILFVLTSFQSSGIV